MHRDRCTILHRRWFEAVSLDGKKGTFTKGWIGATDKMDIVRLSVDTHDEGYETLAIDPFSTSLIRVICVLGVNDSGAMCHMLLRKLLIALVRVG